MYNFGLHIDGQPYTVYPIRPDGMSKQIERETDEMFYRDKISGVFTFVREDFDLINDSNFDAYFKLVIEEQSNIGVTYWQGYFYKTYCNTIDEDNRIVEVEPKPLDNYDEVMNGKEKEFDLLTLSPEREAVKYQKQPLIQIYFQGANYITNILSGVWWELNIVPENDALALVNDYYFAALLGTPGTKTIVVGENLVPDVSGLYDQFTPSGTLRQDGLYKFDERDVGSGNQRVIVEVSSDSVVYVSDSLGTDPILTPTHNKTSDLVTFTSTTSPSKCRLLYTTVIARILTDKDTVDAVPTVDIPENDISESFGYEKVVGFALGPSVLISNDSSEDPTRYGKIQEDAVGFVGDYFTIPNSSPAGEKMIPIIRSDWTEASYWLYYSDAMRDLQEDGAVEINLRHAYPLASVIKVLLAEIAPGVSYDETTVHSDFLNNTIANPVSGEDYRRLFITPKSNVRVGEYDKPAEKAKIKFSDILNMLKVVYNCFWHIDEQLKFHIEHISWYQNGGTYSGTNVSSDLTTLTEPKTRKQWTYKNSRYKYDKVNLPEKITFSWMDEGSVPFDGYDIDIESAYVEKGSIKDKPVNLFTTDLDFVQVQPGSISNDGFVLLACEQSGNDWIVPFKELTADGVEYKVQNGDLANIYLHEHYHKHNLPGEDVKINNETTTATTVKRYKVQNVTFPATTDPDPMQLITTNLGDGKIDKIEINLSSKAAKATIKHEQ